VIDVIGLNFNPQPQGSSVRTEAPDASSPSNGSKFAQHKPSYSKLYLCISIASKSSAKFSKLVEFHRGPSGAWQPTHKLVGGSAASTSAKTSLHDEDISPEQAAMALEGGGRAVSVKCEFPLADSNTGIEILTLRLMTDTPAALLSKDLAVYSIAVANIHWGYRAVPLQAIHLPQSTELERGAVSQTTTDLHSSVFCRFREQKVAWDHKGKTKLHGTYMPGKALQDTETEFTEHDTEHEDENDEEDDDEACVNTLPKIVEAFD